MYAVAIGEAFRIFVVLLGCALLVVWLGRGGTNQRTVHGAAVFVVLTMALSLGAFEAIPLYLALYASAHVALVLQWTYRRAERMPPSGLARLYAVFAGVLLAIAGAVAGGWYWDVAARNIALQKEASAAAIVDPNAEQSRTTRLSTLRSSASSELARSTSADSSGSSRVRWDDEKPPERTAGAKRPHEQEATDNRFAKYLEQEAQPTPQRQFENHFDQFDQPHAASSKAESVAYGYEGWERDPWTGAGLAGCFLWFTCLVRFLALWIWRGFRHAQGQTV
jgi:hypothetical protein